MQPSDITATPHYPKEHWTVAPSPDTLGWSRDRLDNAHAFAQTLSTSACLAIVQGQIVWQYGAIERVIRVASIRKSLLDAQGLHVAGGQIALDATLETLGIDDTPPGLTAEEKHATVRDLLTARSGVYHPANYQPEARRASWPARGSQAPGTFWLYNNWDFNALGTIFERCTGTHIFEEFDRRIARPIGMQDYRPAEQRMLEGPHSVHPSYAFYLSARDLARFGLLYLRQGVWRDRQLVPPGWVAESTRIHSRTPLGPGFGYLWWVENEGKLFGRLLLPPGSYASYGFGGQFLVIIPTLDVVVVHLCHHENPRSTEGTPTLEQLSRLLILILDAHRP